MEYIAAVNQKTNNGIVGLAPSVVEFIAAKSIEEMRDVNIIRNLRRRKAISCKVIDGHIQIDADVQCKTGINVTEQCAEIQDLMSSAVRQMTGFEDVVVNVNVKGFFN